MKCYVFSKDLMFSSQAAGSAKAAGYETQTIMNVDLVEPHDTGDYAVVVDLTMSGMDIAQTVAKLKTLSPPPRVVAVGPHVHEDKLAAAQEAGCDLVLSKGQASRELGSRLQQLS